jgi:hypothetical protein
MSRTATFLALVLSFATGAHAESLADARKAIVAAQAAWAAHGPHSYEFTVRFKEFIYVFCKEQSFRVTRGHIQVLPSADCHPVRDPISIGTIARLLKYANHIARGSWPSADFRFDTTTGVPYAFDVWDESLEDAFSGFAVTKFVAIAP